MESLFYGLGTGDKGSYLVILAVLLVLLFLIDFGGPDNFT